MRRLARDVVGHVQQRARRRDPQPVRAERRRPRRRAGPAPRRGRCAQTLRPSTTPSDSTRPPAQPAERGRRAAPARAQVDVDAVDRQLSDERGASAERAEVGREQKLDRRRRRAPRQARRRRVELARLTGPGQGTARRAAPTSRPPRASARSSSRVDRHAARQQRAVEAVGVPCASEQERDRPESTGRVSMPERRAPRAARRASARGRARKRVPGASSGHEVVVVGVEPLGHLQRPRVGGAAGEREVGVEPPRPVEALRTPSAHAVSRTWS